MDSGTVVLEMPGDAQLALLLVESPHSHSHVVAGRAPVVLTKIAPSISPLTTIHPSNNPTIGKLRKYCVYYSQVLESTVHAQGHTGRSWVEGGREREEGAGGERETETGRERERV